jgi:L-seryl-tRNA(Ser) seleniumtransferase
VVLPSAAVALPDRYAVPLRLGLPPVVGRVERGSLLLDLRCVPVEQDGDLEAAVLAVHRAIAGPDGA